jgi:Na+/H+ antiporter NhaD/arsenite permease-like protein
MRIFDSIMYIFHFFIPFSINLISATLIIIMVARTHSITRKQQTYRQHLRQEFHQHKHLIISPIILVILAFPRLIISFLSGCMKSIRDPWLFHFAYTTYTNICCFHLPFRHLQKRIR